MMAAATKPLVPAKIVIGALVFLAGALLLADSLGMTRTGSGWAMWPLALVAVGVAVRVQPTAASHVVGAILLVAGVWLLLNAIDVWSYPFWDTWPLILILLGTWMLYRTDRMRQRAGGAAGFDRPETTASELGAFAFLSQVERKAIGQRLLAGEMSSVLGDCSFDLTGVDTGDRPVVIDAFALGGRVRITVPEGWIVRRRVLPLIAKAVDRRETGSTDDPVVVASASGDGPCAAAQPPADLLIRGTAILGTVEVTAPQVAS